MTRLTTSGLRWHPASAMAGDGNKSGNTQFRHGKQTFRDCTDQTGAAPKRIHLRGAIGAKARLRILHSSPIAHASHWQSPAASPISRDMNTLAPVAAGLPRLSVLVAAPRGFCAGVDRAIHIVELALERWGAPVYVRHEIVHNRFVVDTSEGQGRDFRRGTRRSPRWRAGGIFGAWRAQGGAGGGRSARR